MTGHVTLAIDAATDRLTVAVAHGDHLQSLHVDGPRRHAREALGMVDTMLSHRGLTPRDITRVISGDGPGSFTGLRVASAVAKALVWGRPAVEWWTAPSLLARAAAHAGGNGPVTILAISDALRGELYAGCWHFASGAVNRVGEPPHAMPPEALAEFTGVDVVLGSIPESILIRVAEATGREPIVGECALPDARWLVALAGWTGGLARVGDAVAWHPQYGRPAEAQAAWEARHGRRLPDSTHRAG